MKNLLTTQQLREKYNPDSIFKAIEKSYNQNLERLLSSLNHSDSPLQKYNRDIQISLLDANQKRSDELIDEIKLGMSFYEIEFILGEPDSIIKNEEYDLWVYNTSSTEFKTYFFKDYILVKID